MLRFRPLSPPASSLIALFSKARHVGLLLLSLFALCGLPSMGQAQSNSAGSHVYAWGGNQEGELGNGSSTTSAPYSIPTPVLAKVQGKVVAVAGGPLHSLALTADGKVYAWGGNQEGELGNGTFTTSPPYGIATPGVVKVPSKVVAVACGAKDSMVLTGLPWGAGVEVMWTDGTTSNDYLIAYDGMNITLSGDVTIDGTGKVSVGKTYPLSQIASITPVNDASAFNKYIVDIDGDIRTYKLLGYSNGVWSLEKHSINTTTHHRDPTPVSVPDADLNSLVAIYRTNAPDPAPTLNDVRNMLNAAGTAYTIPPHVLYGLAYEESGNTHRWQQFGLNDLGITDNKTCVTWDGGIGLMQLTQAAATVDTLPADGDLLSHIYRLGSDTAYNINAGARKLANLKAKDEVSPRRRPAIGSGDRRVLESWYYALWGYNGWSSQNDPSVRANVYEQRVFNWIAQAPTGYWAWGLQKLGVPDKHDIGSGPGWMTTSYIPAPWHFDANYDGNVVENAPNLTITQATATKSGSNLLVSLTLSNSGTANAPNVRLVVMPPNIAIAYLGGKPTTTSIFTVGRHTIAQQDNWIVTLKFPAAGFTSGQSATLQITGAYTGTDASNGTPFTASGTVTIP